MILNNSFKLIKKKVRHFYLNSNLYNKRITPLTIELMEYQPSPSLLDCLIKYDKKKINMEDYSLNEISQTLEDEQTLEINISQDYALIGDPISMFEIKFPAVDIRCRVRMV